MLAEYLERPMETLLYSRMNSPVGPLLLGVSNSALLVLAFDHGLPERIAGRPVAWRESRSETKAVRSQLEEYFAGQRRDFTIPLDLRGTDFQKQCWEELLRIPFGETRSYAEIARAVGRPNAYRAVGQANHYNPIAIVVPCHRVLAAGTMLGGYGGGLATKAFLLRLEGAEFQDDATVDQRQPALNFS
jgi:methylated-DNA-[protein]-cysteine S-methyltransferase